MSTHRVLDFEILGDERGSLVALEGLGNIPFDIKRVYYVFGTSAEAVRGCHAHKTLQQVIVCTSGSCDFMLDDGEKKTMISLDSPARGLYIKGLVWREFTNFSEDCVVMVLASEPYNPDDYIRDYGVFLGYASR